MIKVSLILAIILYLLATGLSEAVLSIAINPQEVPPRPSVIHWNSHITAIKNDHPSDLQLQRQATIITDALILISNLATDDEVKLELDTILRNLPLTGRAETERDEVLSWLSENKMGPRLAAALEERITRAPADLHLTDLAFRTNDIADVTLTLERVSAEGISGFAIDVSFPDIVSIQGISVPNFPLGGGTILSPTTATINGVDISNSFSGRQQEIVLATFSVRALTPGKGSILITNTNIDNDKGLKIPLDIGASIITVN